MTIKKSVKVAGPAVGAFICGAPDAAGSAGSVVAKAKAVGVIRGQKRIITIGFEPEALAEIDAAAARCRISRAAWINLACSKAAAE